MRIEVIRCDQCKKEHDAQYMLPHEWVTLKQGDRHGIEEERHFCSKDCLRDWLAIVPENAMSNVKGYLGEVQAG